MNSAQRVGQQPWVLMHHVPDEEMLAQVLATKHGWCTAARVGAETLTMRPSTTLLPTIL